MVARCRNAIDYTRPIDIDIERLILDRLELEDTIRLMHINVNAKALDDATGIGGEMLDTVMPWLNREQAGVGSAQQVIEYQFGDVKSKVEALKRMAKSE